MTENSWNELEKILGDIYDKRGLGRSIAQDKEYLKKAYYFTENLWSQQLDSFSDHMIRFVLFGEAPLFGEEEIYFYNKKSKLTSFFRHRINPQVESLPSSADKAALFQHLRDAGFIILDLFPFALNDTTALNYQAVCRDNKYTAILDLTYEPYLKPKLKRIKDKSCRNIRFCFRYKKHLILKNYIGTKLNEQGFLNFDSIGCIGSSNMPVDKNKLQEKYSEAYECL